MKVAIVHELLTMKGGAERIVQAFMRMYPEAPVTTLLYDKKAMNGWIDPARVRTSSVQNVASPLSNIVGSRAFHHHFYLPLFPRAVEALAFPDTDLVLSSSSAYVHGINVPAGTAHVCYVHTPARYLWDLTHEMVKRAGLGRFIAKRLFLKHRIWDATVAQRPHTLVAASKLVQRRIQLYWGRESTVIHPFADDYWFAQSPKSQSRQDGPFLVVANLRKYKGVDRAIDAARSIDVPLVIVGDGPMRRSLERRAHGARISFVGRKEGEELRRLYEEARALVVPGIEDFGINAVEALACGTPVVASAGGGTVEIFDDGVSGITADAPTADALAIAMRRLSSIDPIMCRTSAERFTRAHFEQQMYSVIDAAVSASRSQKGAA